MKEFVYYDEKSDQLAILILAIPRFIDGETTYCGIHFATSFVLLGEL